MQTRGKTVLHQENLDLQRLYSIKHATNQLLKLLIQDISLQEVLERALDIVTSESNAAIDSQGGIFLVEEPNTLTLWAHKKMPLELLKNYLRSQSWIRFVAIGLTALRCEKYWI